MNLEASTPRRITSSADIVIPTSHHERKAQRRSTKKLQMVMNLATTKAQRIQVQRDANPRTTKEEQMSTFVDPRRKAEVAAQLAPVPVAKKRTVKVAPTRQGYTGI